jgi:hypothetical protein
MVVIYFAGMEAYPELAGVAENVLGTFTYKDKTEELIRGHKYKQIMIDSGVFTYFHTVGMRKKSRRELPDMTALTHQYCQWLQQNKKDITHYIEFDIDELVGWEKQIELRKIFEEYDLTPLHVWHPTNKMTIREYAKKYDYFGVGSSTRDYDVIKKILYTAHKEKSSCHLFGYTRIKELTKLAHIPSLKSVDSTMWIGSKFGTVFQSQSLIPHKTLLKGRKIPHKIVNKWNIIQLKQWERKLNTFTQSNRT